MWIRSERSSTRAPGLPRIGIPKVGSGNFGSIARMLELAGAVGVTLNAPDELASVDAVILAGVGAFDHGMSALKAGGWVSALEDLRKNERVPLLGICLGMQLLCESSAEGKMPGLSWIPGRVESLKPDKDSHLRVPNMGWREVTVAKQGRLLNNQENARFYFVHSFALRHSDESVVTMTSQHGGPFICGVESDLISGVQFHPEKSHRYGLGLVRSFVEGMCIKSD